MYSIKKLSAACHTVNTMKILKHFPLKLLDYLLFSVNTLYTKLPHIDF